MNDCISVTLGFGLKGLRKSVKVLLLWATNTSASTFVEMLREFVFRARLTRCGSNLTRP